MTVRGRGRLENKVAIVTGAGSRGPGVGTGKAISILFAREGCRVLLVNRVAGHASETLETIRGDGGEASIFAGDVTRADDCERMVDEAASRYGGLNILVNNVGIGRPGSVVDISEDDWDLVLSTNLKTMMLTSRYAIPKMIARGGGSIVNISSMHAWRTHGVDVVAYDTSKGGVISLTQSMAVTHGPEGIRVNCIAPGNIYTPFAAAKVDEKMREARRQGTPLRTEGTAWDAAWAAVYLASDESRWVTGATIPVDGGLTRWLPLLQNR